MASIQLYMSQNEWDNFNKSMADIFNVEYVETPFDPTIIIQEKIKNPKHSHFMMGENNPNYGKPKSDITKKRLSESNKGVKRSDYTKSKCSESAKMRWVNKPIKRKPLTDEQKRIISEKTKLALLLKNNTIVQQSGQDCQKSLPKPRIPV